jgi:hypothetical protein
VLLLAPPWLGLLRVLMPARARVSDQFQELK